MQRELGFLVACLALPAAAEVEVVEFPDFVFHQDAGAVALPGALVPLPRAGDADGGRPLVLLAGAVHCLSTRCTVGVRSQSNVGLVEVATNDQQRAHDLPFFFVVSPAPSIASVVVGASGEGQLIGVRMFQAWPPAATASSANDTWLPTSTLVDAGVGYEVVAPFAVDAGPSSVFFHALVTQRFGNQPAWARVRFSGGAIFPDDRLAGESSWSVPAGSEVLLGGLRHQPVAEDTFLELANAGPSRSIVADPRFVAVPDTELRLAGSVECTPSLVTTDASCVLVDDVVIGARYLAWASSTLAIVGQPSAEVGLDFDWGSGTPDSLRVAVSDAARPFSSFKVVTPAAATFTHRLVVRSSPGVVVERWGGSLALFGPLDGVEGPVTTPTDGGSDPTDGGPDALRPARLRVGCDCDAGASGDLGVLLVFAARPSRRPRARRAPRGGRAAR